MRLKKEHDRIVAEVSFVVHRWYAVVTTYANILFIALLPSHSELPLKRRNWQLLRHVRSRRLVRSRRQTALRWQSSRPRTLAPKRQHWRRPRQRRRLLRCRRKRRAVGDPSAPETLHNTVVVFRVTVPTVVRAESIMAEVEAPTFAAVSI